MALRHDEGAHHDGTWREDLQHAINSRLRDLAIGLATLSTAIGPQLGLNRNDVRALEVLIRYKTMTAGQLASELKLTTGAVTGVIDRLEQAGHAARAHDDDDRRKVVVNPTPKGLDAARRVLEPMGEDLDRILFGYAEDELRVIDDFLDKAGRMFLRHSDQLKSR